MGLKYLEIIVGDKLSVKMVKDFLKNVRDRYAIENIRRIYHWDPSEKAIAVSDANIIIFAFSTVFVAAIINIDFSALIQLDKMSENPKSFMPWSRDISAIFLVIFIFIRGLATLSFYQQKFQRSVLVLSLVGIAFGFPLLFSTVGIFDGYCWFVIVLLGAVGYNMLEPKYVAWAQLLTLLVMITITYIDPYLPYDVKAYMIFDNTYIKSMSDHDLLYIWVIMASLFLGGIGFLWFLSGAWQEREEDLRSISYIDELTSVLNRRSIMEGLTTEFQTAKETPHDLSVAMIDLDHFKDINDTYGHQFGDLALKFVAEEIQTVCRKYDLVGRYGGEEFLVVFPECMGEHVTDVLDRIRKRLRATPLFTEDNKEVAITFTAGVAQMTRDDEEIKQLIEKADTAMYQGKSWGRNRVVLYTGQKM